MNNLHFNLLRIDYGGQGHYLRNRLGSYDRNSELSLQTHEHYRGHNPGEE